MRNLAYWILINFLLFSVSCQSQNQKQQETTADPASSVSNTILILEKCLKGKDFKIVKPYLDEKFNFKNMESSMSIMIMQQVVNSYPLQLQEIKINKITKESNNFIVNITLVTNKEDENHELVLASDYQIIKADIVNIQVAGHHGNNTSPEKDTDIQKKLPDDLKIPITFNKDNLITTVVQINGKEYEFIIDTAAPQLIINSDALSLESAGSKFAAHGSTSEAVMSTVKVNEFKLKELSWKNFNTPSTSLGHLGKSAGLIGAEVFNDYLSIFDYKNKEIILHKLKGDKISDVTILENFKPIQSFRMSHLSVIEVTIGEEIFNLIVDTGASTLMLNGEHKNKVNKYIKLYKNKGSLKGAGKEEIEIEKGILSTLTVAGQEFKNLDIIINETPRYSHEGRKVDGIIGYGLLSQAVFAYNPATGKMYIKK